MSANDQSLLQQWVYDRDAEAFRQLTMRHASMVYNTSRRILRDPTDAEDVAQECFEALVRAGNKPGAYLGAWLHRVATNLSLNRIEARRRSQSREDRFSERALPDAASHTKDLYDHVDKAIAALPDKLRLPLVAHFLENQTHDAIAESIGVSRQTVTYRIGQAVERVRATLKHQGVMIAAAAFAEFLITNNSEAVPTQLLAKLGKLAVASSSIGAAGTGLATLNTFLSLKTALAAAAIVAMGGAGALIFRPNPARPLPPGPASVAPARVAMAQSKPPETNTKHQEIRVSNDSPETSPPASPSPSETVPPTSEKQGQLRDGRAEVERILDYPMSVEFEDIHISEIMDFISDSWDLNIVVDPRVVLARSLTKTTKVVAPVNYVTDGMVSHVDVRNVSLGGALRTLCRPLGLDFSMNNGILSISSPELITAEGFAGLMEADDSSDPVLEQNVSLAYDSIHLAEILAFVSGTYDVNITLDQRAVESPQKLQTTPVEEVVDNVEQLAPPFVSTGVVPYIKLKEVTLREGLETLLRPLNLAYAVEDGFVWISTPGEIESEPFAPADTSHAAPELIEAIETPGDFNYDDRSLADALGAMAEQAKVSLLVDTRDINLSADRVDKFKIEGLPLSTALGILLRQHNLDFIMKGEDIIVASPTYIHTPIARQNTTPVQQLQKH